MAYLNSLPIFLLENVNFHKDRDEIKKSYAAF